MGAPGLLPTSLVCGLWPALASSSLPGCQASASPGTHYLEDAGKHAAQGTWDSRQDQPLALAFSSLFHFTTIPHIPNRPTETQ